CQAARTSLKSVADMPRALSRLALNRGGPRDLGALRAGFEAADAIVHLFAATTLPRELAAALASIKALPRDLRDHLSQALDEELPLLKRDGGFVRSSYNAELDEMRALRDESRKVIAG
ncbi:DNA mismatch repair protein MutS, partial [bacterium M00.F.Ca.ET.157.01.1.1]